MNARKVTFWVVGLLIVLGIACVAVRWYIQREATLGRGDSLWRLTYEIEFQPDNAGTKLYAAFPYDTRYSRVFRQDVRYGGLRVERLRMPAIETRRLGLVAPGPGSYNVLARFDLHLSQRSRSWSRDTETTLTAESRSELLKATSVIQSNSDEVKKTWQTLRSSAKPGIDPLQQAFEYCVKLERSDEGLPQDAASVLQRRSAAPLGRARAFIALCRGNKIPARMVQGFEIKEQTTVQPHLWVEVLQGKHWRPFDPDNGFAGELPHNFVPVRRDGSDIVRTSAGQPASARFSILKLPPSPGVTRAGRKNPLSILDLTRLPLQMHDVLSLVMLLPLGGLVTAVFRTIVGIRTFGTFTPTLIALSFVFADWRTGIFVFVSVLSLGLISRRYLDKLRLLMVPRLTVILTLVVLCIVFSMSLLDYFSLTPSAQAVLLPMVILTMTIERFYLASEEDSVQFAMQLLGGTLAVGVCCYLILRWASAGEVLLTYPELHLITVGLLILIGRYTGYRLTELWRFRDFVSAENKP